MAGAGAGAVQGPESQGRKRSLFAASGGGAPSGASPATSSSAAAAASSGTIDAFGVLRDGARNFTNHEYEGFVRRTKKGTPGKAPRVNHDAVVGCRTIDYTPDNFEASILSIANMLVDLSRRPKCDCQILIGFSGSRAGAEQRIAIHTSGSANHGAAFKGDCCIPINSATFSAILELSTCPPGVLLETIGYDTLSAVGFRMWNREHSLEYGAESRDGCSVYLILLETSTPRGINPWKKEEGMYIKKVRKPHKPPKKETSKRTKRGKPTTGFSKFTVALAPRAAENLRLRKIERQVAVAFGILSEKDRAVASKWWEWIRPQLTCSLSAFEAECTNLPAHIADNPQELGLLRANGVASGKKLTLISMWEKCKEKFG